MTILRMSGFGKGNIVQALGAGLQLISVGHLLQNVSNDQVNQSLQVRSYVRKGTLVLTEIIVKILKCAITRELRAVLLLL